MAEPRMTNASDAEACPPCPDCQNTRTTVTVESARGVYCRCPACGNMWHSDGPPRDLSTAELA